MGEIADMMLDGTMDCETGEFLFDGEDGPGFPMTAADRDAIYGQRYQPAEAGRYRTPGAEQEPAFKVSVDLRTMIEAFGELRNNDRYHWQVRRGGVVVADWWPHKGKYRIAGQQTALGNENVFLNALLVASAS